jgi:cytochrome c biogenesis factor
MATLGYFTLLTTFVVCSYAAAVSVAGARRGSRRLVESGIGAFHMVTALMVHGIGPHDPAFVTDDFLHRYVSRYSDSFQPLFFKITFLLGWTRRLESCSGCSPWRAFAAWRCT